MCVERGTLFSPQVKDPPSPKTIKEKEKKISKAPSIYHFYLKKKKCVCTSVDTEAYICTHTRMCPTVGARTGYGGSNM